MLHKSQHLLSDYIVYTTLETVSKLVLNIRWQPVWRLFSDPLF
jgi:hypothetical protein